MATLGLGPTAKSRGKAGSQPPAVLFDDSIFWPPLLPKRETTPLIVCSCQPVSSWISARVTPLAGIAFPLAGATGFAGLATSEGRRWTASQMRATAALRLVNFFTGFRLS